MKKKTIPAKPSSTKPHPVKAPSPAGESAERALVRDLAQILRDTELTEIEVEKAGLRVRVARQVTIAAAGLPGASDHAAHSEARPVPAPATVLSPALTPAEDRSTHPGALKSPMVGTAYAASQPGAAPFVKLGDSVKEGQTCLIIEAMKTMNQIPAPRAGKVIDILFKDATPVEFGEVLLIIE